MSGSCCARAWTSRAPETARRRRRTSEAEKVRTRLFADADELKVARTKATVGALLERWMAQHEIDPTTRMTYELQIRMYIGPNLGDVPLVLFVREASQRLETLYSRLRKCRSLCNGRPFVEKHAVEGPHDCAVVGCKRHVCKPYAASSVRSIHVILSGACSAAVRWGWIEFNPMPLVRPPSTMRPQPRPPTSTQMARIVETAWTAAAEWGLSVWLSAVLGARRREVIALQWEDIDLDAGIVRLDEGTAPRRTRRARPTRRTRRGRRARAADRGAQRHQRRLLPHPRPALPRPRRGTLGRLDPPDRQPPVDQLPAPARRRRPARRRPRRRRGRRVARVGGRGVRRRPHRSAGPAAVLRRRRQGRRLPRGAQPRRPDRCARPGPEARAGGGARRAPGGVAGARACLPNRWVGVRDA
ncbi:putative ABC transporter ATP-binding protein [Pseudonocardia sp. Ae168_Ps1]|nr:putative ABC transporter ATP-binding protein [Pseudonocardia sp. Ae150A_Ps1]OLL82457.1 putative ABC transporter ATP-binding protein [Pseudonocardia sp. Ae168_Ps1]OLL83428.1 putative ABC transporter ATP-binding protein [Pseudonocardia sp. Ae263_Ps1]OLL90532.1 putative ABC transporter ATP-binding protein [Pseudonocardia sp. Ae356_Ps1]